MKKNLFSLLAVISGISLTAYNFKKNENIKEKSLEFVDKTFKKKISTYSWCVFKYIGGPQDSPNSYVKVTQFVYISNYCPGSGNLCAIYAEEDFFTNPGHPTQSSLDYLLTYYGSYYYFPYEVPGLIEFKWSW